MAGSLKPPSAAMRDLAELDLFYKTWSRALGADGDTNRTGAWLRAFGGQTKWLPAESWTWWLEVREPPEGLDLPQALGFLSLVIGLLGQESPSGEAVRYAREMVEFLGQLNGADGAQSMK
jgi:hypothetical protein